MAVDVNTASRDELIAIDGIGEELADAIIHARPFQTLEDLLAIRGIGEGNLAQFEKQGLIVGAASSSKKESVRYDMAKTAKDLPMQAIPAGVSALKQSEEAYEGEGRYFCALPERPERVFAPGVVGDRVELINLLGNKWASGTVLRYYFFDRNTDGENVMFTDGMTEWRTWVGDEAQKAVVREGSEAWPWRGL